mgnify:CR=1 FL=1
MLDAISKQVNTSSAARSTRLLQMQGQYETFALANMNHEADKLQAEIKKEQVSMAPV